ncbi:MAG: lipid II:glycine glycyltransferase FemX [Paludibacteraceae bacterium]
MITILGNRTQIDVSAWNALVTASSTATWFQTPEAYDFYASLPQEMQPFVVGVADDNKLCGVVVGYVTQDSNALKQFFTRRAIIIGGPLLDDNISDTALEQLLLALRKCLKQSAIYIEMRNFNDYSRWRPVFECCGFAYQPHLNFHIDTSSVDTVEHNLGKGRKRDIRTSLRDGAVVVENPSAEQLHQFYVLLQHLYRTKVKTPLFSLSFFEHLQTLASAKVLLVAFRGEIIGGTVCMCLTGRAVYEWFVCGQDGVYKNIFPSSLATYAGIRYAAEHEMSRFDMMGAGTPTENYGVRDFKARFGGRLVEHGRWLHICKPLLYHLGTWGVKLLKKI